MEPELIEVEYECTACGDKYLTEVEAELSVIHSLCTEPRVGLCWICSDLLDKALSRD